MLIGITIFLTLLIATQRISAVSADGCIGNYAELTALQVERGANNSRPVTYVICPNTVFNLKNQPGLELNGNTNYLCGEDGSSKNNCVVTGGSIQFIIALFAYDLSNKDNILLSGFTFENAEISNAAIASSGSFIIRDCIFKDNINHSVLALIFYIPPALRRRNRILSSSSIKEKIEIFDYRNDFMNYLKDEKLQKRRMNDRSLLIGGGSEPRLTLLLDRVQFLNNTLTSNLTIPSLASNGPFDIFTAFADVTVSQSLFKENNYPYSRAIFSPGFGIRVASSSTVNISNTCFVNNYFEGSSTVWIQADSGLVSSQNNYVSETPIDEFDEPIAPCQYIFKEEAYKCFAPESNVCGLPACAASYKLYNARKDKVVANVVNGGTITSPPCDLNIEVVLPCATTGKNVSVQLLQPNGTVIRAREEVKKFFLFGNTKTNIYAGKIASGTYTIQAVANGIVQPSPATFTLAGNCRRN